MSEDLEIKTAEGVLNVWDWGDGQIVIDVNCGSAEHADVTLTKEQAQKLADHLRFAVAA